MSKLSNAKITELAEELNAVEDSMDRFRPGGEHPDSHLYRENVGAYFFGQRLIQKLGPYATSKVYEKRQELRGQVTPKVGDKVRYPAIDRTGTIYAIGSRRNPGTIHVKITRDWNVTLQPGEWEFA